MGKTNLNERVAQDAGYPATLFGFSPCDNEYWEEPGLPYLSALLNPERFGLSPLDCAEQLVGLFAFAFTGTHMAPRFLPGCTVAGRALAWGSEAVQVGGVLAVVQPGDTPTRYTLGRVGEVGADHLLLTFDNSAATLRLPWALDLVAPVVYQITHYMRRPLPWAGAWEGSFL